MKNTNIYFDTINHDFEFVRFMKDSSYKYIMRFGRTYYLISIKKENIDHIQDLINEYITGFWKDVDIQFEESCELNYEVFKNLEKHHFTIFYSELQKVIVGYAHNQYKTIIGKKAEAEYERILKLPLALTYGKIIYSAQQDKIKHYLKFHDSLKFKQEFDNWVRSEYENGIPHEYFSEILTAETIERFIKYRKEMEELLKLKEAHRIKVRQFRAGIK